MMNRKMVLAFVMLGLMAAATSYAFVNTRVNNLTFSRSVELPGVRLAAGAYSFEVLDPGVGVDIVRVWDREHTRIYYTGITHMVDRPRPIDRREIAVLLPEIDHRQERPDPRPART